jgi:hypothetical protein
MAQWAVSILFKASKTVQRTLGNTQIQANPPGAFFGADRVVVNLETDEIFLTLGFESYHALAWRVNCCTVGEKVVVLY